MLKIPWSWFLLVTMVAAAARVIAAPTENPRDDFETTTATTLAMIDVLDVSTDMSPLLLDNDIEVEAQSKTAPSLDDIITYPATKIMKFDHLDSPASTDVPQNNDEIKILEEKVIATTSAKANEMSGSESLSSTEESVNSAATVNVTEPEVVPVTSETTTETFHYTITPAAEPENTVTPETPKVREIQLDFSQFPINVVTSTLEAQEVNVTSEKALENATTTEPDEKDTTIATNIPTTIPTPEVPAIKVINSGLEYSAINLPVRTTEAPEEKQASPFFPLPEMMTVPPPETGENFVKNYEFVHDMSPFILDTAPILEETKVATITTTESPETTAPKTNTSTKAAVTTTSTTTTIASEAPILSTPNAIPETTTSTNPTEISESTIILKTSSNENSETSTPSTSIIIEVPTTTTTATTKTPAATTTTTEVSVTATNSEASSTSTTYTEEPRTTSSATLTTSEAFNTTTTPESTTKIDAGSTDTAKPMAIQNDGEITILEERVIATTSTKVAESNGTGSERSAIQSEIRENTASSSTASPGYTAPTTTLAATSEVLYSASKSFPETTTTSSTTLQPETTTIITLLTGVIVPNDIPSITEIETEAIRISPSDGVPLAPYTEHKIVDIKNHGLPLTSNLSTLSVSGEVPLEKITDPAYKVKSIDINNYAQSTTTPWTLPATTSPTSSPSTAADVESITDSEKKAEIIDFNQNSQSTTSTVPPTTSSTGAPWEPLIEPEIHHEVNVNHYAQPPVTSSTSTSTLPTTTISTLHPSTGASLEPLNEPEIHDEVYVNHYAQPPVTSSTSISNSSTTTTSTFHPSTGAPVEPFIEPEIHDEVYVNQYAQPPVTSSTSTSTLPTTTISTLHPSTGASLKPLIEPEIHDEVYVNHYAQPPVTLSTSTSISPTTTTSKLYPLTGAPVEPFIEPEIHDEVYVNHFSQSPVTSSTSTSTLPTTTTSTLDPSTGVSLEPLIEPENHHEAYVNQYAQPPVTSMSTSTLPPTTSSTTPPTTPSPPASTTPDEFAEFKAALMPEFTNEPHQIPHARSDEARSLSIPARIHRLLNQDGVEVLSGYSVVELSN